MRAWLVTEEYRAGVSGEWFFTCLSFSHPQRQSADETQRQSLDFRSASQQIASVYTVMICVRWQWMMINDSR